MNAHDEQVLRYALWNHNDGDPSITDLDIITTSAEEMLEMTERLRALAANLEPSIGFAILDVIDA